MAERQYIKGENEPLLLQLVANGDKLAFERLYDHYEGGLEKYVFFITRSQQVTEEIIQDIFVSIWQKKEQLPTLTSFRGYLYTIARNRVISYLRSVKTRYKIVDLDETPPDRSRADTDHLVLYNQYYKMVLDAIALLPERKREIFTLSLEEDLTLDEIAQRLGLSKSTVKQHLYSATNSIREYLQKHGNITTALLVLLAFFES
jgi:RNA polymerase sigma-19 factor, ECF subfamily